MISRGGDSVIFVVGLLLIFVDVILAYFTFFSASGDINVYLNIFVLLMSIIGYPTVLHVVYHNINSNALKSWGSRIRDFIVCVLICLTIPAINYYAWGRSTGNLYSPDSMTVYLVKFEMIVAFLYLSISFCVSEVLFKLKKHQRTKDE